jgi:hypothetical protein
MVEIGPTQAEKAEKRIFDSKTNTKDRECNPLIKRLLIT